MNVLLVHALRLVHIVGASFWVGVAVLNVAFLAPAVRATGPAGGQVMRQLVQVRRLPAYVNGAALLTVLTGIALYGWRSAGFASGWLTSASGLTFGIGGVLGVVAALNGHFVIGRTMARIGRLAAAGAEPTPELRALQGRAAAASLVGVVLVVTSAALMAVARYL